MSVPPAPKKPRSSGWKSNRIVFTLNNYSEEETTSCLASLNALTPEEIAFAIVGKEVGASGTPHLQGFIHLKPKKLPAHQGGVTTWKRLFPFLQRAHLEKAYGDDHQSWKYCSKDGNLLVEVGSPALNSNQDIFSLLLKTTSFSEASEIAPDLCVKHYSAINAIVTKNARNSTSPVLPPLLSSWQRDVARSVLTQSRRKISFVVDTTGNSGKSILAQSIRAHFGSSVFYCRGGKSSDIVHAFSKNRDYSIAIFDYARNKLPDYFAWDLFEELKDGGITSLKYDGDCYWLAQPVRVLVLTNHDLSDHRHRLTEDRWDVHVIDRRTDKTPIHDTVRSLNLEPEAPQAEDIPTSDSLPLIPEDVMHQLIAELGDLNEFAFDI